MPCMCTYIYIYILHTLVNDSCSSHLPQPTQRSKLSQLPAGKFCPCHPPRPLEDQRAFGASAERHQHPAIVRLQFLYLSSFALLFQLYALTPWQTRLAVGSRWVQVGTCRRPLNMWFRYQVHPDPKILHWFTTCNRRVYIYVYIYTYIYIYMHKGMGI